MKWTHCIQQFLDFFFWDFFQKFWDFFGFFEKFLRNFWDNSIPSDKILKKILKKFSKKSEKFQKFQKILKKSENFSNKFENISKSETGVALTNNWEENPHYVVENISIIIILFILIQQYYLF